jgi:Flp pilus assembly protein TadG
LQNPKPANREKGTSLFLGTISLVFIMPLIGLFIDVGILYAVKARLQASVDGASLAAARALNLGQTTAAQAGAAQQNAVNWFYANYPNGNWATTNTVMSASTVQVFDDPNNPNLRNVTVTATSTVPTYFMRWFNVNSTTISASGNASRRDVVAVLVLDRSGSMCAPGSAPCSGASATPCGSMVTAAKVFTGQFAQGRDRIGLVSYSDASYVHSVPSTNFQTTLGYTNNSGSGSGQIDSISCGGGTGTAEAMALAYHLLYQINLPGALNVILLETDGLPNSLSMNFYDSANNQVGLANSSGCQDTAGKTMSKNGFKTAAVIPNWLSPWTGLQLNAAPFLTTHAWLPNIPGKMVGTVDSSDPGGSNTYWAMINYWTAFGQTQSTGNASYPFNSVTGNGSPSLYTSSNAPSANGCGFQSGGGYGAASLNDFAWWPATDIVGNQLNPSGYTYYPVTTDAKGHVTNISWTNYHNGVMNATDNSAYQARTNATIPATVYAIGLGGNSTLGPPDPVLLQRMANDSSGDTFNATPAYPACSTEPNCQTWPSQPQGEFIYSPNATSLGQAFQAIASQVLRLSK